MLRKFVVVTFFTVFANTSYGSPVWPMHAGEIWEYTAYPTDGSASWKELWQFGEEVTLDSKLYFPFIGGHFRSTEDKIFEWKPVLGETLFFQIGPIGTTWDHSTDNTVEILDNDFLVEDVYGGPYEAYSYGKRWNDEIDPYLIESFVPGLGFIKIVDYWVTYPPVIKELISISPDNLCGDYDYPYPEGDMNQDCIVNFKDLSVIAEHWLVCTRPDC